MVNLSGIFKIVWLYKAQTESGGCSVMSDSVWSYGLQPTRLLCPWDSPSKNTGMVSHSLLQGVFSTQRSKPGLLCCRQILFPSEPLGKPQAAFKLSPNRREGFRPRKTWEKMKHSEWTVWVISAKAWGRKVSPLQNWKKTRVAEGKWSRGKLSESQIIQRH